MRILAAGLLLSVALGVASSAPAQTNADARTTALKTVRLGVSYAITLENNAVKQEKAGQHAEAKKELQNALHLLDQIAPEVKSLTPPRDFNSWALPNEWQKLNNTFLGVVGTDERALSAGDASFFAADLAVASHFKQEIYKLVDNEIRRPMCAELINLRSMTINGVKGPSQLSVDVSCNRPEKKVIVVVPTVTIVQAVPDGGAVAAAMKAANVVEVDLNGAKSGGVTMQTSPDATAGAPVDDLVVPIAGDSHAEYFDEVM